MAWVTALSRSNYPAGNHGFGPVALPAGLTLAKVRLARYEKKPNGDKKTGTDWPVVLDGQGEPTASCRLTTEVSYDGGTTWLIWFKVGYGGGVAMVTPGQDGTKVEAEFSTITIGIPRPSESKLLRGTLQTFTALGTIIEYEVT